MVLGGQRLKQEESSINGVDGSLGWEHHQEAVEEEFIGWEEELRVIDEVREGCLIEKVWCRWKEKIIAAAAAEKGIGREKMTERSEGWWSDEVERLIDARKVACSKLRGARKRGEEEGVLKQLWVNYRRVRKGEEEDQ